MLHFGFSHFVINIILQVALGTIVESVLGPLRMVAFYAIVALGSNLFGGTVTATYATGSEGVIYGFIGALFSIILVYWGRIGGTTCTKVCTVFMVVTVFIMATFLMTTTASTASRYTSFFR
ncbi:MAG: rhomboid family intramembrane serine protease, partial [bacterium]